MTPAEAAAIATASRELLSQGDAEGAERVLAPVLDHLRADAPALHLMGLIKKAQNQLGEAERYLRKAVAHALDQGGYYNDLGVVLQARGEYAEALRVFRAAMALTANTAAVRTNIVRCLAAAGDLAQAEREARAYVSAEPGAESWSLLGQVQRLLGRDAEALTSAEAALRCAPQLRGLRYNYAVALDRVGRGGEALEIYESLAKSDLDTPDLALNFIRALYAAGRRKDAETLAEEAAQTWPDVTVLHTTLARIRWLRGEGEKCTELIEAELLWRRPSDMALRLACADALHRGGHFQKAAQVLEEARRFAPDSPAILSALGVMLDELDRPRDGLAYMRTAAAAAPDSVSAKRNLLSVLMRAGQAQEALELARKLRADDPDEQYLIACEALALRMLGDDGYRKLCDYERLVRAYDTPPPQGHFTIESFNAALADLLRQQHRVNAHPLDQPRPNFSQTGRSLLALADPLIKTLLTAFDPHVRDYLSRLTEQAPEPLARRRGKSYRYANLWSVRLTEGGAVPNLVHDRGWISGVYTVSLLPAERPQSPHAGWLQFGQPNRPPLKCGPERLIEPRPGQLVLFPSYVWHGVLSVEGAEALMLAFTLTPS